MNSSSIKMSFAVAVLLLLSGCATQVRIAGVPTDNTEHSYHDGLEVLTSNRTHSVAVIMMTPHTEAGAQMQLWVHARNRGEQDITLSRTNVSARQITPRPPAVQSPVLHVFSPSELMEAHHRQQAWAAVGAALQGAAEATNASNAGYSTTHGTLNTQAYTSTGGSAYGQSSFSATTYNHVAAQQARDAALARNNARAAQLSAEGQAKAAALQQALLRRTTIRPDDQHGGIVHVAVPKSGEERVTFEITVTLAGESHSFKFVQQRM